MVYRKYGPSLKKKRVGYRRRRTRGGWRNMKLGTVARKAYNGFRYIKSLINVEKKFFDTAATASAIGLTPVISNLSNIAEGNDFNQRNGNSILLQSHLFRMQAVRNPLATFDTLIRCIIFIDNDQRGTDPSASDLLETGSGANYITTGLNHVVNRRFNVLSDRLYTLSNGNISTKFVKMFKKLTGMHIKYQNTAGADASNFEGAMYMLLVSNDDTNKPQVDWFSRLRYTDN